MAIELIVNNSNEFQDMIDNKDFKIADAIITSILNNINTRKQHIPVLSINILEEESILDITLERKFFIETLEENLKYFIEKEKYEDCQKIVEAITLLKNKQNDKRIKQSK
jgi:protein-arginine kinase activator protein McsA